MYLIVIILCVLGVVLFYGSYSIQHSFYLKSFCRGRDSSRSVAITFDDGVDPVMTPKVLEVLGRRGAKATFFVIGEKASRYPEIVKQIVADGHTIGNHSCFHQGYFPLKSSAAIRSEIEMCSEIVKRITEQEVRFFRPPFGVTNPMVAGAVRHSGLVSVGWSIRSFDTIDRNRDRVLRRIIRALKPGSVVLLHDHLEGADLLLEAILSEMQNRGFAVVGMDGFFEMK